MYDYLMGYTPPTNMSHVDQVMMSDDASSDVSFQEFRVNNLGSGSGTDPDPDLHVGVGASYHS
jgi:hypothetical protein